MSMMTIQKNEDKDKDFLLSPRQGVFGFVDKRFMKIKKAEKKRAIASDNHRQRSTAEKEALMNKTVVLGASSSNNDTDTNPEEGVG